MRKVLTLTLGLAALGAFSQQAFAEPMEDCAGKYNNCTKGGAQNINACGKVEQFCETRNRARGAKSRTEIIGDGHLGKYGDPNQPCTNARPCNFPEDKSGKGKGVIAEGEVAKRQWEENGKKQLGVVITDGRGTSTVYFKVGVTPSDGADYSGVKILGPDGHRYAPWDPRLNALLVAGGYKDTSGQALGYMNDATMKNEMALKSDKEVRANIYTAWVANGKKGPLVFPQPTGHRNNDALGNAAPIVRDHRTEQSKTTSPANTPPPAATLGGVIASSPDAAVVRDHRHGGNAAGSSGGVTVTQTPRGSGSARTLSPTPRVINSASPNAPIVRDHRNGGNGGNAAGSSNRSQQQ